MILKATTLATIERDDLRQSGMSVQLARFDDAEPAPTLDPATR